MTYTIRTRVDGRPVEDEPRPISDPFVRHTVRLGGWLTAWRVLRRRCEVEVLVNADPATVEHVLELDPDYLGVPGSQRRTEWNANLQRSLSQFAGATDE